MAPSSPSKLRVAQVEPGLHVAQPADATPWRHVWADRWYRRVKAPARAVVRRCAAATRALVGRLDARDLHVYGGLAIAAAGGWHLGSWELPHAVTVMAVGLALALIGWFA